jgi:hypothetical protein
VWIIQEVGLLADASQFTVEHCNKAPPASVLDACKASSGLSAIARFIPLIKGMFTQLAIGPAKGTAAERQLALDVRLTIELPR